MHILMATPPYCALVRVAVARAQAGLRGICANTERLCFAAGFAGRLPSWAWASRS